MESQPNPDEIIVLCPIQDLTKHFIKDHLVVWHDPNIQSDENAQYKTAIESLCQLKTFTDWEEAASFLQSTDTMCSLITSGTNGELLVKMAHDVSNIFKIFVFCGNKTYHQTWTQNYPKIACVEDDIKRLLPQIQDSIISWQRQASSLRSGLPAFAPIFDARDQNNVDSLHLRLKGLVNFTNRDQAKRDFLALSKAIYPDDVKIAEFEANYTEYNMKTMLNWYTKESFLYKAANNCLRLASTDAIQYSRLILKDLETAIKEQYQLKSKEFSGLLYRGAFLTQEEWDKLEQNIGKDIEMYGFLSTTKNPRVAQNFAMLEPSKKTLITIVVPQGPNDGDQGFAEVKEFSDFAIEDEVLFNIRSTFTVLEATSQEIEGIPCRHLVLLYGAEAWRHHLAHHNNAVKVNLKESPCCIRCNSSAVLFEKTCFVNLTNPKDFVCQKCLKVYLEENRQPLLCFPSMRIKKKIQQEILEIKGRVMSYPQGFKIPFYGYWCCKCRKTRDETYYKCLDCTETQKVWCSQCFEKGDEDPGKECSSIEHNVILESNPFSFWNQMMHMSELHRLERQEKIVKRTHVFKQAEIFFQNKEYEKAVEYFNRYIKLNEGLQTTEDLAGAYTNLARVYIMMKKYEESLKCYNSSLEIDQMVHGEIHPSVAVTLCNLGKTFEYLKNYQKTLEYYFMALKMWGSLLHIKDQMEHVAFILDHIGDVYKELNEHEKALDYYMRSLKITKEFYPNDNMTMSETLNKIGRIYYTTAQYEGALEFFEKALEIEKVIYGEVHGVVADSYTEIGVVYLRYSKHEKALAYFTKALEIKKILNGNEENRPETADCLMNIGITYSVMNDFENTLKYIQEALKIFQVNYGENHFSTAKAYSTLANTYYDLKDYEKGMGYHEKCLEVYKATYGENHALVATTYLGIGKGANAKKDYQKACDNFVKALNVYLKVYGPNHPSTAMSYSQLGDFFAKLGQHEKALEFFAVALGINKKVYGENHPTVPTLEKKIMYLYHLMQESEQKGEETGEADAVAKE